MRSEETKLCLEFLFTIVFIIGNESTHLPGGSSKWMNYGLMEIFQFFHFFFFYVGFNILKWKEFAWFGFSICMFFDVFSILEKYICIFFFFYCSFEQWKELEVEVLGREIRDG